MLTWHNEGNSTWVAKNAMGVHVATAVKTGSYLDNYPWEWYFTNTAVKSFDFKKTVNACDTLATCKREAQYHWDNKVKKNVSS